MWTLSVPWWEFVLRGVVVYVFLLVFLRLTGKRQTAQYAPFDLVLLLILSNAVQNSMNAGDNTLIEALMQHELISAVDLAAALRSGGCLHAHEVERATIETNGEITVVLKKR